MRPLSRSWAEAAWIHVRLRPACKSVTSFCSSVPGRSFAPLTLDRSQGVQSKWRTSSPSCMRQPCLSRGQERLMPSASLSSATYSGWVSPQREVSGVRRPDLPRNQKRYLSSSSQNVGDSGSVNPVRAAQLMRVHWKEVDGSTASALWMSETTLNPPEELLVNGDETNTNKALKLASIGKGLLWRGKGTPISYTRMFLQCVRERIVAGIWSLLFAKASFLLWELCAAGLILPFADYPRCRHLSDFILSRLRKQHEDNALRSPREKGGSVLDHFRQEYHCRFRAHDVAVCKTTQCFCSTAVSSERTCRELSSVRMKAALNHCRRS